MVASLLSGSLELQQQRHYYHAAIVAAVTDFTITANLGVATGFVGCFLVAEEHD